MPKIEGENYLERSPRRQRMSRKPIKNTSSSVSPSGVGSRRRIEFEVDNLSSS